MSTISTTISSNIYYGTGQTYSSPLIITTAGAVITTAAGRAAVKGFGGGTLSNDGKIIGSGSADTGVDIAGSGGTVFNSGLIQGYVRGLYLQGSGYVTNSGTILAVGNGANAAAELTGGGTLTNTQTIINTANSGDGVRIDATGGTVINGGLIEGYAESVGMEQAGVVLNTGTIRVTGASAGDVAVFQGRGGGTLTNQGTIITGASGGSGVLLDYAGGTVINSGLIRATDYGINMQVAGFITNSGTVLSTGGNGRAAILLGSDGTLINQGSIAGSGSSQFGIEGTGAGDTVNNAGTIQGYSIGLDLSGSGTVINSGIIQSKYKGAFFGEADVVMPGGGSVTNTQSGYINNGLLLNVANDGVGADSTVVNAGTIAGGVYLNAELSGISGPEYAGTGTIFDSGTITGSPFAIYFGGTNALLVLQQGYHLNGIVDAAGTFPHTLELQGAAGAPVTVNFTTTEFRNFGTVGFATGSGNAGTLALAASGDVPGTIVGFNAPGDKIDLGFISDAQHDATAILTPATDVLTVTGDNGSVTLQLDPTENYGPGLFSAMPDAAGTGTLIDLGVVCFCRGTRILTEFGEVAVEDLTIGDHVVLFDGRHKPIVWIGEGRLIASPDRHTAATPVIVRKDALDENVPNSDLHITKAHSLYIDGALIPVEFLINHRSVVWDDHAREVSIFHIELESHEIVIANGVPAESYRDDGNRWLFQNGNNGWDLPPKPACAPVLTGGPVVDAAWQHLLDRCGPRATLSLTDDPDLHLMVDGERLEPARMPNDIYMFRLGSRPDTVRIVSRADSPQELGLSRDPRWLGVALWRISVRRGVRLRVMEAEDPALQDGFHAFETDIGYRWTDGNAAIPAELFKDFDGSIVVELTLASTASYRDEARGQRAA